MLNQLLTFIGLLSPLLLFTWLWQTKEWRIDRLREQLRETGLLPNLIGKLRPLIIIVCLPLLLFKPTWWPIVPLLGCCVLFGVYVFKKRQRIPKKTAKTLMLLAIAFVVNIVLLRLLPTAVLPLLLLLQPLVFFGAWLVFYPVDVLLKNKIRTAGTALRAQYPNINVIGITGSVGKTSCKEILAHLLQDSSPLVTPKHINTDLGVSKWLQNVLPAMGKQEDKTIIVEMGAYRLGEIKTICDITQPQYGIITALGQQHIGLFGSQENLIKAKSELFAALPPTGIAFIPTATDFYSEASAYATAPVITVGDGTQIAVSNITPMENGQSGIITMAGENYPFAIPLHGDQVLPSVLLAIAVANRLGVPMQRIMELLPTIPLPDQTFSVTKQGDITILDDSYNASPSSFKAAITWAAKRPEELKILVTPGLIELGEESNTIHQKLGTLCKDVFAEVIFTSTTGRQAFEVGYCKRTLPKYSKNIDADLMVIEGRVNIKV